jgi:acetyltransferase-like isoleucine patch superfamily enzyme
MIKKAVKYFFSAFGLELSKKQSAANETNKDTFATVGENSNIKNVILDVRNPEEGRRYLEVGKNSLITGSFIFEIANGKIKIGNDTFIGGGTFICIEEIEIGNDVMFSWGCTVMDNNAHSLNWKHRKDDVKAWKKGVDENKIGKYKDWANVARKKITIKDKAWIGFDSIILKGVTIGQGAVVGAGSVVVKDVPDWAIVAGNPAQVIRMIPEEER